MKEGEAENRNTGFANTDSTTKAITTGGGRGSFCFVERSSDLGPRF